MAGRPRPRGPTAWEGQRPSSTHSFSRRTHTHSSYDTSSGDGNTPRIETILPKNGGSWPYNQELKLKLSGIPRNSGIKDIYSSLARFGEIMRIDMKFESKYSTAWVIFQTPLHRSLQTNDKLFINNVQVKAERAEHNIPTVPSTVNPRKHYPQFNIISANSIDFGVRVADSTMMIMKTVIGRDKIKFALNMRRKDLQITFPLGVDDKEHKYRFVLPISLLEHIYEVDPISNGQRAFVIPFGSPPECSKQAEDISETCNMPGRIWNEWMAWSRQTDIAGQKSPTLTRLGPVMHRHDHAIIDIGKWTVYRITFAATKLGGQQFQAFTDALADHGVVISKRKNFTFEDACSDPLPGLLQDELSSTHPHLTPASHSSFNELSTATISLDFPVRHQLEVCLSYGYLISYKITLDFLQRLASMRTDEAVYVLERVAERQKICYDPMTIFDVRVKGQLVKKIPAYCVLSRSVHITPTMMHVNTPILETSNRIVRKYEADADRFLRVKFSDEKTIGRISNQEGGRSDEAFNRVKQAMKKGIVVCGRYYQFLAYGNSQFRENGAYFYAPTASVSAEQIRERMGNFEHIKTVAKYGARHGQCFSSTRIIDRSPVNIVEIPDIRRNGFTFTDGVGKISEFLAKMAAASLGLNFEDPPSLFQFRLAGCKGVLALDPEAKGRNVYIRPSQYKFAVEHSGLEIIRTSALAMACFNRQLIVVLSSLGVPDSIFLQKAQEMVSYLEQATVNHDVALERLLRNIDFNQMTLTMAAMVLDGFMKTREPFMMSLLHLWRAFHIKALKEKARIIIEQGAFVLGCVDETATLQGHYDEPQSRPNATREEKLATLPEIFLKISDLDRKGTYKVIQGICVIARNPSLHPGDLRVVRAVDVPALHHLKNVLVLPQTGDRDLANMCSGGDLDGDDYLVMWDQDFIPGSINEVPMDFTPPDPSQEQADTITTDDIAEFFVAYMKNDSLARIALAHLAQADYNAEGVMDDKCLELARLHSLAVDYPKSGIPAIMDRSLQPRKWPHFMPNKHRTKDQMYESKKILGQLYDQVELVNFKPQYENTFDKRILDAFKLDDSILDKASVIKVRYDSAIKQLMAKHDIGTEFEVWSVFALQHNQEMRDYSFAEEFGKTVSAVKHQFRGVCRDAAGATDPTDFVTLAPFVAAMYTVTAREMEQALEECRSTKMVGGKEVPARSMDPENMPMMSFPWLFVSELGRIATGNNVGRPSATIQHSTTFKKSKKRAVHDLEPSIGDIVTKEGTTHFGELLILDFEPIEKKAEEEPSNGLTTSRTETASSLPSSICSTAGSEKEPLRMPDEVKHNADDDEDEDEEEGEEEVIIEFEPKKSSAMDRLKRLL
ncbi:RdRP-domain-containing protein [Polyplosphaeria fusca]|uniref:RNA-dependent RNA polymerase n=1 Tax=Polyplosphaeria fusca TaxID=682080 RepID=A0A9P4RD97_9PLEO|nr:RdRP-domain-containing protein [Polyplosphaeria fusca]